MIRIAILIADWTGVLHRSHGGPFKVGQVYYSVTWLPKKTEGFCWVHDMTLVQGYNGSLSLPGETLVMDGIKMTYEKLPHQ
jgi:hypothetical protein